MGTFLVNSQEDIISDAQQGQAPGQAPDGPGCGWWESNPHGLSPRALRVLRVCQFRHTRTASGTSATTGNPGADRQRAMPLAGDRVAHREGARTTE
jgi:hypothetical protein